MTTASNDTLTQNTVAQDTLPAPTGPHTVGRAAYYWRETGSDGEPRTMVAWIWYPAAPAPDAQRAAYLPAGWEPIAQFLGFKAEAARSHAFEDAPISTDQATYPVVLFSPAGFPPLIWAAIVEEVASHGYIVAGINHTHESSITVFPDGQVVPMDMARMQCVYGPFSGAPEDTFRGRAAIAEGKAADLAFALAQLEKLSTGSDRLAGRMDFGRMGAFGHSLGGNAALEFGRLESRCKAAANLDGANWSAVGTVGLERPALVVMADHRELALPCTEQVAAGVYPTVEWCAAERAVIVNGFQAVYDHGRPGYAVSIAGAGHGSFMDLPFLPTEAGSRAAGGLSTVHMESTRSWRIICDYVLAFFGRHLNGELAPLLDGPSPLYPEVSLGAPKDLLPG